MQKHTVCLFATLLILLLNASQSFALTFRFQYDPNYAQYWTPALKDQIQEAGRFLAGYISDGHEVTITVSVNSQISAHAIGAPAGWLENTNTRSIANKGTIAYSTNSVQNVAQSSVVALTIHELLHCLGFTHSGCHAFKAQTQGYYFRGAKSMLVNGGAPVDLAGDKSHFPYGIPDPKGVSPRMGEGGGDMISALDLAVLSDLGYTVPAVKQAGGPVFVDVVLNDLYGLSMNGPQGTQMLISGMGGNDVLYAGAGKTILHGMGGNDVLVTGSGATEMTGDNNPYMPHMAMGDDGADIFYIKSNSGVHQIKDLDETDKVYISPSIGVTKSQLEAAMQDPNKFGLMPYPGVPGAFIPGVWLLDLGSFKLGIGTKNGQKPTSAKNFEIRDWTR